MRRISLALSAALVLVATVFTAPTAMAAGEFSVWNYQNGARCDFIGHAPTLGQCTNTNYLYHNNGNPCSGCDHIKLYWGRDYTGAYFCIPPGQIAGEYAQPGLKFNRVGEKSGYSGLNSTIWRNAASAKWSGPC